MLMEAKKFQLSSGVRTDVNIANNIQKSEADLIVTSLIRQGAW